MQIKIKINDKTFQEKLRSFDGKFENQKTLMRQIAGDMMAAVEENFAQQGRQPKWKALSDRTIAARRATGNWPGQILQVSGMLASSVASKYDDTSATVSSNVPYAGIHQYGGMAGRGRKVKIPARPFLKITTDDYEQIKDRIIRFFTLQETP